jgi:4-amino-4-deoxy-L-arabinose transferase-like glycosyltransferase
MVVADRSTYRGLAAVAFDGRPLSDCDDEAVTAWRGHIWPVVALLLLGSLAFVHLTALPPYEDEGSQLRWIWRVIEAGEWLQPLGDGKPLEAWPMVPLVRLGLHPLTAMRALHVIAGMIAAVLTYRLAFQVSNRNTAFVSAALFAICPFVVNLQRFAESDIFMCAAGAWVLVSVIQFIQSPASRHAIGLTGSLVLAAFCKFPVGFVFLMAMPVALLLMPSLERRSLLRRPALTKLLAAHAPVALLALVVILVAVIRVRSGLPPGFGVQDLIGIGTGRYRDIAGAIGIPPMNLVHELTAQLSLPVTVIGLIGLAAGALLNDWRQRWLIAVGAVPMLGIGLLATFWFPRYLVFTLPPLIVAAVFGWRSLALRAGRFRYPVQFGILSVCVGFTGYQSMLIIFDPTAARWSPVDRFQYFEGWSSGYGYREAAKFVLETPGAPLMIYSLDGHSAYQLLTYLPAAWISRVEPIFYGQDGRVLSSEDARLENLLSHTPAWIIISEHLLEGYLDSSFGRTNLDRISLRKIASFDKPGSRERLAIYEVTRRERDQ